MVVVEEEEEVSKFNSSNDLIMIINRKITTIMIMIMTIIMIMIVIMMIIPVNNGTSLWPHNLPPRLCFVLYCFFFWFDITPLWTFQRHKFLVFCVNKLKNGFFVNFFVFFFLSDIV